MITKLAALPVTKRKKEIAMSAPIVLNGYTWRDEGRQRDIALPLTVIAG